ncbi:hypothetical protein QAD02_002036 [Eretmocerus hayati]|uniref:Uncharacterized protein n=1 Tax=Eretmocerus hayati TaxID=131215 RepID=A0ACC2NI52_9HYME|nr:hypothetical protein QAD02_002036 [Eretmocerus hayati]
MDVEILDGLVGRALEREYQRSSIYATGLTNLKMTVPERVRVGDSALLICTYDLENATLYTIKWYLDEAEFYRFVPRNTDVPVTTFKVRGITVNTMKSNRHEVLLVNVKRNHTGRYKCEVSEDEPRYDTKSKEAFLSVVDVPATVPRIMVDRQHLISGKTFRANCTSGASHLAPNITWRLNGLPPPDPPQAIIDTRIALVQIASRTALNAVMPNYDEIKHYAQSLLTVNTSGLFKNGRIQLKCFAEISPVYKVDAIAEITEADPHPVLITGNAASRSFREYILTNTHKYKLTEVIRFKIFVFDHQMFFPDFK